MANKFIVGETGQGKSKLAAIFIHDYLKRGCQVATNMNIYPSPYFDKKDIRLTRLIDHPSSSDIENLGDGYQGKINDSKRGLIVLDEALTFLRSTDWKNKGQQDIGKFFLQIRKKRWDVIFIAQDHKKIDPLLRTTIAQEIIITRDVTRIYHVLTFGITALLPVRIHNAKYYFSKDPITSKNYFKKTKFMGHKYYDFYDTEQLIGQDDDEEKDGAHCHVKPYKKKIKIEIDNNQPDYSILRKTLSTFKPGFFGYSVLALAGYFLFQSAPQGNDKEIEVSTVSQNADLKKVSSTSVPKKTVNKILGDSFLVGSIEFQHDPQYLIKTSKFGVLDNHQLRQFGVNSKKISRCLMKLDYNGDSQIIGCPERHVVTDSSNPDSEQSDKSNSKGVNIIDAINPFS